MDYCSSTWSGNLGRGPNGSEGCPTKSEMAETKEMEANTKGSFGGNMGGNDLSHMESQRLEDFSKHRCEYEFCNCTDTERSESSNSHSPEHKGCRGVSDSAEKTN
ncbi:hypothetical protein KY284_020866 [Solanum tuberosum]|nr:hypothetical protein KY284_020866 [Solanum tuberosum]